MRLIIDKITDNSTSTGRYMFQTEQVQINQKGIRTTPRGSPFIDKQNDSQFYKLPVILCYQCRKHQILYLDMKHSSDNYTFQFHFCGKFQILY